MIIEMKSKVGIQAIKSTETRDDWWYYSITLWENPYIACYNNLSSMPK